MWRVATLGPPAILHACAFAFPLLLLLSLISYDPCLSRTLYVGNSSTQILSFARLIGGVSRNYFSPKSAYVMKSWGAAAGAAVAGAAGAAVAGGAQLGASEAGPALERERELAGASVSGSGIASSSSSAFTSFASGSSSISSGGSGSSNVVPVALQSLEEDVMVGVGVWACVYARAGSHYVLWGNLRWGGVAGFVWGR